jgi:hypothetical protein
MGQGLNLADQDAAGSPEGRRERGRIAEREHNCGGRTGQHVIKELRLAGQ